MDEEDFRTDNLSAFDSSVMRSGIPKSMDKVVTMDEDNADLVYRNVDVMSNSSVRRAAGGDCDSAVLRSVGVDRKVEPTIFQSVAPFKATSGRVTGKYQVELPESVQAAMRRVESFLGEQSISSSHRLEAATHCWDCHVVSSCCQLVKFQIQVVQGLGSDCAVVDFKRERGCCNALAQTFDQFRRASGCASAPSRGGRFRTMPPPLPDDEDGESGADAEADGCSAVAEALTAMSEWIESSPVEALQSLGLLYGNKCQHLLRSENLLADVCKSIKSHETEGSDMIALTLALSCLRKVLSIYSELSSPSPLSAPLMSMIRGGLKRAAEGKCLTAKREAGLTLDTITKTVPTEHNILKL